MLDLNDRPLNDPKVSSDTFSLDPAVLNGPVDCLLVSVEGRGYAIESALVRGVSLTGSVTPAPLAPSPVLGLTSLHGRLLPAVGLAPLIALSDCADILAISHPGAALPLYLVQVEVDSLAVALLVDDVTSTGPSGEGYRPIDLARLLRSLRATLASYYLRVADSESRKEPILTSPFRGKPEGKLCAN